MITLGSTVHREFLVLDADDNLVEPATATLTAAKPDGSTVTLTGSMTAPATGTRAIDYVPDLLGRYVLKFRTTVPTTALDVEFDIVQAAGEPRWVLSEIKSYLGTTSWLDADITAAVTAELAAQDRVCRAAPEYPADLYEALKRRVARNLALRALPLGMQANDSGASYTPRTDSEIRRLEAPHRKYAEAIG